MGRENPPPPQRTRIFPEEIVVPIQDWEDEAISKIMLVTLDVQPLEI